MPARLPTPVLAAATFMALSLPSVSAFLWVDTTQVRAIEAHTELVSYHLVGRLQDQLQFRLALLRSLARELSLEGLTVGPAFTSRAEDLQARFPGFQAINWVSPEGRISLVVPLEDNRGALGKQVLDHPDAGTTFARALGSSQEAVTGPLTLFQGGVGFASYLPIDEGPQGFVNGVFRIQPLIDTLLESQTVAQFHLELRVGDETVISNGSPGRWAHSQVFELDGTPWQMTLSPTPELVSQYRPASTRVLLGLGLLTAALGAALAVLWRRRRRSEDALRAQLVQAQRIEALGALSGGIAHDFNNMLTVIGGTLELMERELPEHSPLHRDLRLLQDTADRAAGLTSHLLAFSRHRLARVETFAPDAVLVSTARMLSRLLPESITLRLRAEAPGVWISGDPGSFEQVVVNLALNARDAMEGGGSLELHSWANADTFHLLCIDSGTGMDAETMRQIFDPFFTTKAEGAGTGLGLSMAYRTAQQLGGTLTVASRLGAGTTMQLTAARVPPPAPVDEVSKVRRSTGPAIVLVAEDDPAIRGTFRRALEDAGHTVLAAADGLQASEMLEQPIDLLITDMVMPRLGGAELIERFRAQHPEAPVLCCTGYADQDVPLPEDPGVQVLIKPVRLSRLVASVELLLTEHAPAAPTE